MVYNIKYQFLKDKQKKKDRLFYLKDNPTSRFRANSINILPWAILLSTIFNYEKNCHISKSLLTTYVATSTLIAIASPRSERELLK